MSKKQSKKTIRPQPVRDKNKRHLLALAIMAVSVFLAYSNSLNGTWAMDDVVANKAVSINDIHDFIGARKIASLTFLLNQLIAPFSPASFRLFNIFLHILNASLVYLLAYKTVLLVSTPGEETGRQDKSGDLPQFSVSPAFSTALLSSVIFALHPININAVAYIVQRMASLAAFFVLLSILCYIPAVQSAKRAKAAFFYLLSGIFMIMGILSKENAVMTIPLIFLYDYIFISRFEGCRFVRKALLVAGIGIIGISLVSYFLRLDYLFIGIAKFFININQPIDERIWTAVNVYWTPLQHILTEFRVVSRYILLVFFPLPQFLVFDWWGFPVSKGITEPITTLLSMVFLLSLFIFSLLKMKRFPLLCFGILWYLLSISLESFIAVGLDLYYEHRNYLPVLGLIIGIVGQIVVSFGGRIKERDFWIIAASLCLLLGSLTFVRNFVWKDSVTLWEDTLRKRPSNIRAMLSVGNSYLKIPDFEKAKYYYKEAVRLSNADRRLSFLDASVYRLGLTYLFERDIKQAKRLIDAMESSIESYHLDILKGFYKASSGDVDGAISVYNDVIQRAGGIDIIVVNTLLGDAYREKGMWDSAIERYNKALLLEPSFAAAYYGIGVAHMGKRNLALAQDYFEKALSIEPDNVLALSDMADLMLIRKSNPEDALGYAKNALSKSPPFYQPYLTMGNVLIVLGKEKEAEDYYRKAAEHNAPGYMVSFSKARAYYIKGDVVMTNHHLSELRNYKDLPENIKGIIK